MAQYFANVNEQGIVEHVIVADADFVAGLPGTWIETFDDDPTKKYASIGHGYDGIDFLPRPFTQSNWDANTKAWVTPAKLGIAMNESPIIAADGVDFVTVYLIGAPNSMQEVLLNAELLQVITDGRGYGEFELSSNTPGLITIEWGGFNMEVAAI